jgi:hypothetical protein
MLINQNDSNIITLSEVFEGILHCLGFSIRFDGKEVGGVGGAMTYSCEEETGDSILQKDSVNMNEGVSLLFLCNNYPSRLKIHHQQHIYE